MASMMDEMQKTLARRRAKVDRSSEEPESSVERSPGPASEEGGRKSVGQEVQEKGASPVVSKGPDSPRPDTSSSSSSSDLEAVKQEILREMRKEINKAKQEIIDVIRQELSRR